MNTFWILLSFAGDIKGQARGSVWVETDRKCVWNRKKKEGSVKNKALRIKEHRTFLSLGHNLENYVGYFHRLKEGCGGDDSSLWRNQLLKESTSLLGVTKESEKGFHKQTAVYLPFGLLTYPICHPLDVF